MLWIRVAILLLATGVLAKTTELVVEGLSELSRKVRVGKYALSVVVLALSTSFPELFVGVTAALSGEPSLSLGNVLGSNIANISLVMGIATVIGGSIPIVGGYLKKDFWYAFLAGMLPVFLILDGTLSRVDGLALIVIYGYYVVGVLRRRHVESVKREMEERRGRLLRSLKLIGTSGRRPVAKVLFGMAILLLSADLVVKMASQISLELGVPTLLIGLILVAVGTSLPELVVEIAAVRRREVALIFGNLLGSTVANSTLIIGLTVLISPIEVQTIDSYLIASLTYLIVFGAFWIFSKSKRRLTAVEGGVLIFIYGLFVLAEFLRTNSFE